jgi:hypothetical protein
MTMKKAVPLLATALIGGPCVAGPPVTIRCDLKTSAWMATTVRMSRSVMFRLALFTVELSEVGLPGSAEVAFGR